MHKSNAFGSFCLLMLRFFSLSLASKSTNASAARRGKGIPICWTPWRTILQRILNTSNSAEKITSLKFKPIITLKWTVATILTIDMLMRIMINITILNFTNRTTVKCTIALMCCNTNRATVAVMIRGIFITRTTIRATKARFLFSCNMIRLGWANLLF